MALDPGWSSTMFAVYIFAGTFVQGIAAVTLATVAPARAAAPACAAWSASDQLHDLGKMLFAFSIFWAYIWVCQYLLIWYGNIPEEVTHYVTRTRGPLAAAVRAQRRDQLGGPVPRVAVGRGQAQPAPAGADRVDRRSPGTGWTSTSSSCRPSGREPRLGLAELALAAAHAALLDLAVSPPAGARAAGARTRADVAARGRRRGGRSA